MALAVQQPLFLFLLLISLQSGAMRDEARFRPNCPQAPCWRYWNGNCYCVVADQEETWTEALKFCKRYRQTELATLTSILEKNWILSLPLDNFWIGLNNLEESDTFSWSEGTPANMRLTWLRLSHPVQANTTYCVKISKHSLVALHCDAKAHWICKQSVVVDRYQKYEGKVLLSPPDFTPQVHTDLVSAKAACLQLREQCTGITVWNDTYALTRGTVLLRSEESHSVAYVKSDCSMGYFGRDCSSVCSQCYGNELCNPYTGVCDNLHSCRAQHSPAACEQALKSVWCPRFSGWQYWENNCYYFSAEAAASWIDARKQCRRFRNTDLLWLENKHELKWLFSGNSSDILWTGLNSRKQKFIWHWSNMKSAAKVLHWMKFNGSTLGSCVGLNLFNKTALRLNCEEKYRWICKKKEVNEIFDVYVDQYLSGPLEPMYYTSLFAAVLDCLSYPNCTGVVQDYNYYRRTTGIDEIYTCDEIATAYIKRECSFGYYGDNCASLCQPCYGGFRCNSVTGKCPERMECVGQFKGELCALGIKNPKCPHNAPWWFFNGHCFYFEKEAKGNHAWASVQCSYYKDGNLVKIDNEKEKEWLGNMLETDSWIGLMQGGSTWKWSGGREDVNVSQYSWLWDFPSTANGCAQMLRGGKLRVLSCTEHHFYVCEKEIAGLDLFVDYPGKIMLTVHPLAVYRDLDEARFHCLRNVKCTGISSWPNEHYLVTGIEMVTGLPHHIVRLKTNCILGRHGYACTEECPMCRDDARCNMLTGFCDEKTTCKDVSSIEKCAETTVSERCPDMDKWRYWNRHCFYFSQSPGKPWHEANSTCSHFRAAELLWFEDKDDLAWLTMFVTEIIWIGLQDINYDYVWAWSHEDNASKALECLFDYLYLNRMQFEKEKKWKRCADLSPEGIIDSAPCHQNKKWACKRPAERDLDVYTGFWDSVMISEKPSSSANSTYEESKDACIEQKHKCLGYALWQNGFFMLNGPILVGGGFGPSIAFLKSACDYGYYGSDCAYKCLRCYWDKPCHPITGKCEHAIVCATPDRVGGCSLGLYSLKCSLGFGWWYWHGQCYLIEKNRKVTWKEAVDLCKRFKFTRLLQLKSHQEKVWLQKKITEQMWIGMKWQPQKKEWQWGDGRKAKTNNNWLKIEGDPLEGCGTLLQNKQQLQCAKCNEKFYFICERIENKNIFQEFKSHIIPQRRKVFPKIFHSLEIAQEDCIFQRTTCTGIVLSQGQYYMVSGRTVFKSLSAGDMLYLKNVCNPGFHGTNCQFKCQSCGNGLPCHGVTGECVGNDPTKCVLDSQDPKCEDEVFVNPCPKKQQWHYYSKLCYYVEDTKTDTWANARIACQGFKGTDLVKITSSSEKMWVQHKGDNSWIGLTFYKRSYKYLWVDLSSSVFQNAWVVRRSRRYTQTVSDCGVAFKNYLSVTDCSEQRKWICKREAVDLFTEHIGRAFYLPGGNAAKYPTLDKARQACLVLQACTGIVEAENNFMLHTGMDLYNTRNKNVTTWIKSDCAAGRFGEMCEQICRKCDDGVPCNPHTGLCGDSVFCSETDPTSTCEKATLIGGRCPLEWVYWRGNCYYISKTEETWQRARDMCNKYNGSDLVWITSKEEKSWLLSILPEGLFWTGLHGHRFCTRLQWSYTNVSYTAPEWLRKKSWTWTWNCCLQLSISSDLLAGTSCYKEKPWICKKREEETPDFRKFDGYYLVGSSSSTDRVIHQSLSEAIQHCRFQRKLCNGVQRIRNNYTTFHTKRLVFINGSFANLYTAYLKSVCSPGYFGRTCDRLCTCNGTDNCNPLTGKCAENQHCSENYIATECEQGVTNLRCPSDPGWWYWKGNCYYIETTMVLTWEKAKDFCMAYKEADLLPPPSDTEEKIWLTSMIKGVVWIGPEGAKAKNTVDFRDLCGKAAPTCTQMDENGNLKQEICSSLAAWGCKRSVEAEMFQEYSGRMLLLPLESKTYADKEHARSACLLEEKCTGISYWENQYIPVSGKELILTNRMDVTYMKTACNEGHFGIHCQKCPDCPKERPCNRLTGKCAVEVSCKARKSLARCEVELKSKYCFYSWIYYNEHCYYIPKFGLINKSDADYMCSQFENSQLVHLSTDEEKDWLTKIMSRRSWIGSLGPALRPKTWFPPVEEKPVQRSLIRVEELCLQLDPGMRSFLTVPCSFNSSWVCKSRIASMPVDGRKKWWLSLTTSFLGSSAVLIVTVLLTLKFGVWVPEAANEVKPQSL
ncbi:uncharacterized protein LOC128345453 isoform X3 [Hemicordylus capensis]|uniref:uncharacterized protein LOC128345453 isoform X3 n=1 Tax=Hemicordylus capensis TaxID=884348 RepID=UPI0023043066|nr:uncharacterized protein LOC128345453 isoform X3 [Hemicordylus capensis]